MEYSYLFTNKEVTPCGGMVFLKQFLDKMGFCTTRGRKKFLLFLYNFVINPVIMPIFKERKATTSDLLKVIPEDLLSHLSQSTSVDYYSKVLHGKKMFYLLLYGILENDRLSQRTLEDTFNDSFFKAHFRRE